MRSPIICLYGPPGGKAKIFGQKYSYRIGAEMYVYRSVACMTKPKYVATAAPIGAMPGRIIKGFLKAGAGNPYLCLMK